MRIQLNSELYFGICALREAISQSLDSQRKKVAFVVTLIFGVIASIYLISRFCCKGDKNMQQITKDNKIPQDNTESFLKEEDIDIFHMKLEDETLTVDDKNIQKTAEDNIDLIQKFFLRTIDNQRKYRLGNLYDRECDLHHDKNLKTIETHLATLGCDSEGVIKSFEGVSFGLETFGSDVRIKKVSRDMFVDRIPELISATDKLYFCKVHIKYFSQQKNDELPFILADYPQIEPIKQVMDLMIAKLNKRASKAALVNFKNLPRQGAEPIV